MLTLRLMIFGRRLPEATSPVTKKVQLQTILLSYTLQGTSNKRFVSTKHPVKSRAFLVHGTFGSKRSYHPLIAWSLLGKVIVRYSAWILGRVGIEMLKTPEDKASKSSITERIRRLKQSPFKLVMGALFTRKAGYIFVFASSAAGAFYYSNIEEVPITGRQRFNVIRPEMLEKCSEDAALQLVQGNQKSLLPANHPAHQRVERICRRLAAGAASIPELRERAQASAPKRRPCVEDAEPASHDDIETEIDFEARHFRLPRKRWPIRI
jgi:hypothetical protein